MLSSLLITSHFNNLTFIINVFIKFFFINHRTGIKAKKENANAIPKRKPEHQKLKMSTLQQDKNLKTNIDFVRIKINKFMKMM